MTVYTPLPSGYTLRLQGNQARLITPCGKAIKLHPDEYAATLAIVNDVDDGLCGDEDLTEQCAAIAADRGIYL